MFVSVYYVKYLLLPVLKEWLCVEEAYFFLSLFIYFETDRDNTSGGGAEREGERERIPSRLHNACKEPNTGPEYKTMRP